MRELFLRMVAQRCGSQHVGDDGEKMLRVAIDGQRFGAEQDQRAERAVVIQHRHEAAAADAGIGPAVAGFVALQPGLEIQIGQRRCRAFIQRQRGAGAVDEAAVGAVAHGAGQ